MRLISMRSFLAIAVAIAVGCTTASSSVAATILASWTYETSVPTTAGPHAAEVGAGSSTGNHVSASTVYSNPAGNGSLESFSSNFWTQGDSYQFQTSTLGYQNIFLSWDQTRSSTGPADFKVEYSTDNASYFDLPSMASYTVPAISWSTTTPDATGTTSFSRDLSAITALNNAANIYIRLTQTSATGATAGTNRVDNVTIMGEVVPEPASLALLSLAGVALVGLGRRRS